MRKVKTFFHIFKNSLIPTSAYYKKLLKTNFGFSFKYFISLVSLLVIISLLAFAFKSSMYKKNYSKLRASVISALDNYPADLLITVENGRLSTTYERPYILFLNYNSVPHPLLVVDERAEFEKIDQYKTTVLVTSKGVVVRDNQQLKIYRFRQDDNFTINKTRVDSFKKATLGFFRLAPFFFLILLLLAMVAGSVLLSFFKLVYFLIPSLLVFIVVKFFVKKVKYGKVFQISLHSTTLPILFEFLLPLFGFRFRFPFWFFILTVVFLATAVYEAYLHPPARKKIDRSSKKKKKRKST